MNETCPDCGATIEHLLKRKQTVNGLLKNKLTRKDANYVHASNPVTQEYWSPEGWVAFRDELGLLWLDHSDRDEPYASDDDEHPSEEKPLLLNEACDVWIGLEDERGSWYRLEGRLDTEGQVFVLIYKSMQHTPYERELNCVGFVNKDGEF